jgi:adenosylhomocysteine nucleosidase
VPLGSLKMRALASEGNVVGIVTAMATEVWPLIRSWERNPHPWQQQPRVGHPLDCFVSQDAVVLCGGIGYEAGKRAAEAVIEYAKPDLLIATGLAGGLKPEWTLGRTMVAAEVMDEATGRRFRTAYGEGTVISSREIARAAKKRELAARFSADVVDMEGAAVAEVAEAHGLPFLAVKAVMDDLDFELPPLQEFVDAEGRFQHARFGLWAVWHPRWWLATAQLKMRTDRAAAALAGKLREVVAEAERTARGSRPALA